jgi:hypothetical protein
MILQFYTDKSSDYCTNGNNDILYNLKILFSAFYGFPLFRFFCFFLCFVDIFCASRVKISMSRVHIVALVSRSWVHQGMPHRCSLPRPCPAMSATC